MNKKDLILVTEIVSNALDVGIYPKSIEGGGKPYKKRSAWKNGWNAANIKILESVLGALDKINTMDDNLAFLVATGLIREYNNNLLLGLNDTFYYASADAEKVETNEIPGLARLARNYGYAGVVYWASLKRNETPQIPRYKRYVGAIKGLENNIT